MSLAEYLKTVERLEPDITSIDPGAFYASAAISIKRIANALEYRNYFMFKETPRGNPTLDELAHHASAWIVYNYIEGKRYHFLDFKEAEAAFKSAGNGAQLTPLFERNVDARNRGAQK